ncbi:hypothetical protein NW762_010919 [Fusarium torreyae]|uniref:Major facilitator superfamily (MFS) profile domain-containing protein n=1 Tax=Fusarium torreyae TaxID=1237075 RepID=A0A9W8VCV5_9HYPO|nr:hypothetical protein NW762_010919 [Fusarium torreyae]
MSTASEEEKQSAGRAASAEGTSVTYHNKFGALRLRHPETNHIILIPAPTDDPNDPLNWPKPYRVYIAVLVSFAIFFGNFLAAGPTVAILDTTTDFFGPAGPDLDDNIAKIAYFFTTTALLQGLSNLTWMPLMAKFGRRPIYFISFTLYTAFSAWAGGANTYGSALAARIMMGAASGAAECLAPLTISDLFFAHERGAIMAIYTTALSAGVGCGIIVAGLITKDLDWRYIYWVSVAVIGFCTILIIFTFPETRYDRSKAANVPRKVTQNEEIINQGNKEEDIDPKDAHDDVSLSQPPHSNQQKRTYWQSLAIFSGIHTQESFSKLFLRPIVLLALPPVLWATLVMAVSIGFLVAITSNFAVAFDTTYDFEPWQAGLCFISCPVGAGFGAFFGGRFSDMIADKLTSRNDGVRHPEMRLPAMAISLVTAPLALVLYGVGIERSWHWIVPTIGLGLLNFSIVQATNISLVYTIDGYRPVTGELAVTQHAFKSAFGFLLSFYTNPWIDESGYDKAFAAMAGISGSILLMWVPMYIWGRQIRHASWTWPIIKRVVHWAEDREVGE